MERKANRPMTNHPSTDALWSSLSADLRRFIRRRVSDDHVADDLLQETFVRVHRNQASLEEVESVAAWVYRIARNVINDHHRQASGAAPLGEVDPQVADEDVRSERRCGCPGWLGELVHSLPDGYRQAVEWSEIDGLNQQEVADRLGLSLSGAKSRVQRGRQMLKEALDRCCRFEFDRRGNMLDYEPKPERTVCRDCGGS
jgi:RNA polymerase sigma-70 factor (ECF subfamily)